MSGPQTAAAEATHSFKYRREGETFRDGVDRVASALRDNDKHFHEFRDIMLDMRFMPAGRIQAAIGSSREITAYNCFVSGTIPDSFVNRDNPEQSSIIHRLEQAATTMRMGGGMGYNFGTLRPRGAMIKKLQSHSTGPLAFMDLYNGLGSCTASAGERRGAQMGVLPVWHPDIQEFINVKHDQETLKRFNLSVGITDDFMEAVARGSSYALRFGGEVYREVDAGELYEQIMRSTWDWAEPGVLFLDTINKRNNLYYCEEIVATNPCAEQPLPPFGACLLGSFNLTKYLRRQPMHLVGEAAYDFNWDQLHADIPHIVRAMDNVVDRSRYPLEEQAVEAQNKRRMGLGVMGLANAGEALGHLYGSPGFVAFTTKVLNYIANQTYQASAHLAQEKGAFPLYDAEKFGAGYFLQTLDEETRELVGRFGLRNSHLTSQAPTGTISLSADNVSSGVEPVFSYEQDRPIDTREGPVMMHLADYGAKFLGVKGRRCDEATPQQHLDVLIAAANQTDSSVSKTINLDGRVEWDAFKRIYSDAWEGGAKGCTTFNKDGKRFGLLTSKDQEAEPAACTIDPETGARSCAA